MTNDDIPPLLDSPHAPVFSLTRLVRLYQRAAGQAAGEPRKTVCKRHLTAWSRC